jgi:signal peptidase I
MIGSVERYSSSARKRRASLFGSRTVKVILISLLLYLIVSRFFVSTFRVDSVSMDPLLRPADKVMASIISFGGRVPFTAIRLPGLEKPARGDIVVVQPPYFNPDSLVARIFEPFVSFFSLQKVTLHRDLGGRRVQSYIVKRIVGMPGDTIRMRGFAVSIRPRGAAQFVPESELVGPSEKVTTAFSAKGWQPELPFSGNGEEIVLAEDQYFVLGDNRPDSSDSRSWGPVSGSRILAKVILRYWPPREFGKL